MADRCPNCDALDEDKCDCNPEEQGFSRGFYSDTDEEDEEEN